MDDITPFDPNDPATDDGLDLFIYLAQDELAAIANANDEQALSDLDERMAARRSALDEFSRRRLHALAWDHESIQGLFDRAGLPL